MDEVKGQTCEFPKPNGKGVCGAPATEVVMFHGLRWSYNAKACDVLRGIRPKRGKD